MVLPHIATKDWQEKQCVVTSSALNQSVCACSEHIYSKRSLAGCQQTYPCLQIYVSLETPADVSDANADFNPDDRAGDTGKETKTDMDMQALKQSGHNGFASRHHNAINVTAHQSMASQAGVDYHQSSSVKSRLTRHKHNELLLPFGGGGGGGDGGTTAEGVDEQELGPVADAKERRNHSKTQQQRQQSVDGTPTVAAAAAAAARHGTDDVTSSAHVLLYRDWKDTYYEPVSTSCKTLSLEGHT